MQRSAACFRWHQSSRPRRMYLTGSQMSVLGAFFRKLQSWSAASGRYLGRPGGASCAGGNEAIRTSARIAAVKDFPAGNAALPPSRNASADRHSLGDGGQGCHSVQSVEHGRALSYPTPSTSLMRATTYFHVR